MKILILGAGAVGGFFGAHLLNAGRDVTFLVRPSRAAQLAAFGLQLRSAAGDLLFRNPRTLTADTLTRPFDLILLSCKAFDLAPALDEIAPAVGPSTAILPLLNGLGHMTTLDTRFGREHVLGGSTSISTTVDQEGRILHLNTLDMLQFGDRDTPGSPAMHSLAQTLSVAGIHSVRSENILQDMWQKWVTITSLVGITCLMRATIADIVAAQATPLVDQLIAESSSIASAEGFPPAQPYLETLRGKMTQPGSPLTASMLRDLEAGHRIEASHILGDFLAHAARHSLATPLLAIVYHNLRCYESRRARELETHALDSAAAPSPQK